MLAKDHADQLVWVFFSSSHEDHENDTFEKRKLAFLQAIDDFVGQPTVVLANGLHLDGSKP